MENLDFENIFESIFNSKKLEDKKKEKKAKKYAKRIWRPFKNIFNDMQLIDDCLDAAEEDDELKARIAGILVKKFMKTAAKYSALVDKIDIERRYEKELDSQENELKRFDEWCNKCAYKELAGDSATCGECISHTGFYTHPMNFKEEENK